MLHHPTMATMATILLQTTVNPYRLRNRRKIVTTSKPAMTTSKANIASSKMRGDEVVDGSGEETAGGGVGVGSGADATEGASGCGAVKKGMKATVPKLKSSSKSKIDWLIAAMSFVPHQLLAASISFDPTDR